MRQLICGSRYSTDRGAVRALLESLLAADPELVVIVGYDPDDDRWQGVDQLVFEEAVTMGLPVIPFPAPWRRYGPKAGPMRNGRMLAWGQPQRVHALRGGRGTANMIDQAHRAGVQVEKVGWE
jgi:hypothetical protein